MTLTGILASVIIIPAGFIIPETFYACDKIQGSYNHDSKKIYVCEHKESLFTTYHEVGHYYWFNYLTEKEREEYTKLFKSSKTHFRKYSSTSAEEDFADAYGTITQSVYLETEINRELKKRQRLALRLVSKYY